jgi:hypothetical protein
LPAKPLAFQEVIPRPPAVVVDSMSMTVKQCSLMNMACKKRFRRLSKREEPGYEKKKQGEDYNAAAAVEIIPKQWEKQQEENKSLRPLESTSVLCK